MNLSIILQDFQQLLLQLQAQLNWLDSGRGTHALILQTK